MMKNYIREAIIIGLAIVVGFAFFGGKTVIEQYGASSGPDHYNIEYFWAGLVDGGEVVTLTSAATSTITVKQVCEASIVNFLPLQVGTTTFPEAAAINTQCLMVNGASKTFLFRNIGDAASTTVLTVASTTSDTLLFKEATSTDDVIISGQDSALITFLRTAAATIVITVLELTDAD